MQPAILKVSTVLSSSDAGELAAFYRDLLGWDVHYADEDWVSIGAGETGPFLSFQSEDTYVPPVWPATDGYQQMMLHLDFQVADLPAATDHALATGARIADFQPQEDCTVFLDPAGHPFCLFTG